MNTPPHPPLPPSRRSVSPAGLALIRDCESFSPVPYRCPAGKRTIGYGHVLRPPDRRFRRIDEAFAENLLREDLAPVEIYLRAVLPDLLQNEFDALASFCFNVGLGAFENSTLFALLKAGDPAGAASQFGRWVYAGDRMLPGLIQRRARERDLFVGGGPR